MVILGVGRIRSIELFRTSLEISDGASCVTGAMIELPIVRGGLTRANWTFSGRSGKSVCDGTRRSRCEHRRGRDEPRLSIAWRLPFPRVSCSYIASDLYRRRG